MKSQFQTTIIEKLRRLRIERNMSQAHIARALGISPGQLGNIESYKRSHKYTLKQIYTLSTILGVTIEELFSTEQTKLKHGDVNGTIEQIIRYQDDKEENK